MKPNRIKSIEQYILENGTVNLDKLCEVFSVSKNTIRRDINELVESGSIKKVYGGATATSSKSLVPFEERNIKNINDKVLIAKSAASFVNDGDIIYIDSGTTTQNMIEFLKDKSNITILTNNLNVVVNAIPYPNLDVIALGGKLVRKTNSLAGIEAVRILRNYNITKAFMATTGFSLSKGVTNSSSVEYEIKKTAVEKCDEVYILADSSKLDSSSLMTYCYLKDIHCLITDKEPAFEYVDYFKENNIQLVVAL